MLDEQARSGPAARRRRENRKAAPHDALAEFFASAPFGFAVWRLDDPDDPDSFRLLFRNRAAEVLTGLPSEQLFGKTIGEMQELIQPGIARLYLRVVRAGGSHDLGEFTSPNGSHVFAIRAFALPDNCVGVAFEDVADRRRAERSLRVSQSMNSALLDAIPDLTVRFRLDGLILDAREGKERLTLPAAEALIGKSGFELAPRSALEAMRPYAESAIGTGKVQTYEYAVPVNGQLRYREVRVAPSRPDEVVAIFRDITERKQAEEALRKSEAMTAALLDAVPDLMIRLNSEGRIMDFRPGSGYAPASQPQDVIGKLVHDVMPAGAAEQVIGHVQETLTKRAIHTYEYQLPVGGALRQREGRMVVSGPGEVVAIIRDITERRRGEDALRESEERFRLLAEHAQDIIFRYRVVEPRGYEYVSPAVTRMSGCKPECYYADPDFAVKNVHPEDLPRFQDMLASGHQGAIELRWITRDGNVIWTEQRDTAIRDESGEVIAVEGIVRDITARKRAEDELRQSEERFRLLAENAQDIIFRLRLIEPIGFDYISPALARLTGYSPDECYRNPNFAGNIVHSEDREAYRRMVWERQTAQIELRWVRKDGAVIWIEQRSTPVYDDRGRAVALEGVVRDITDRVRAEETLRESEERFRLLAENAQDMIFRYRAREPYGFDYVSPAVTAIAGYMPEQYYADPDFPAKIIHPEDRDALDEMMAELQEGPVELRWICADGSVIWTEQRSTFVRDGAGELVAVEAIVRDVTTRKRTEDELRDSEQRYRLLAERAQDVIFRFRATEPRGFEYVSPAVTAMSGYTPAQYYDDPDFAARVTHPDDLEAMRAMARERSEGPVELRWVCADGSLIWTEQRNTLIYDDSGELLAVEGIIRDVTQRKRAEQALRASEERFRLLAERAQDMLYRYRVAPDRGFDYVSPFVTALLGYAPEECYADPEFFRRMIHPDDLALVRELAFKGQSPALNIRAVKKDGSIVWLEQRNVPVYDRDGTLIAIEGIARDSTARKREEEALLYQAGVLANVQDAVISTDSQFTVRTWNPAAEQLYGWKAEEVIGQHAGTIFGEQVGVRDGVNALGEGGVFDGELTVRRKDGAIIVVDVQAVTIRDPGGQLSGYVSVARDMTERRRAEEQRQLAREKLEAKVEEQLQRGGHPYRLTFRELTVLNLVATGKADKEIAAELGISPLTVHKHLTNILGKMSAASRTEAGVRALREGLLS
jgi:PAS domain S-box-containing protein